MTDIAEIVKDAPTHAELADIAGELAARVQELEAALRDVDDGMPLSVSLRDLAWTGDIADTSDHWVAWLERQADAIDKALEEARP